jgi:predicted RNase H-like nuclease (RuvC/YqgF family)
MAIGDYIKQAAAYLRRAAVAQKNQTDELRRQITYQEQEIGKRIAELNNDINQRQREIALVDNDAIRAERLHEVVQLNDAIKQLRHELEKHKQQLNQQIQQGQTSIDQLNLHANNFERQASSMGGM